MTSDVSISSANDVLTITLNRVHKKNSFTSDMYVAVSQALQSASEDPHVRVIVFAGSESVFTAGNDIDDFLQNPPTRPDAPVAQFLYAISECTKPIVAAVCGPAIGVGTTMLLHCDIVVAGDNAVFAMPFTSLGVSPEAGSSVLLPQLVGYQRAAELLLLGSRISAADAQTMGLVNRVVAADRALAEAQLIAEQIAALPRASVLETKRALKAGQQAALRETITDEMRVFAHMLQQPAAQEALTAFNERRPPDFRSIGQ